MSSPAATTWGAGGPGDDGPAPGDGDGQPRSATARAWTLRREQGVEPFESADPDTARIWWTDAGVHQNLTFPVQPDPVSGMHCWHQAVRVRKAEPGDRYGDVSVDTAKAREAYEEWLSRRPARDPALARRRRGGPYWLLRPLKPAREAYQLPGPRFGP